MFDVSQRFHEAITSIGGMWGGHSGAVWMLGSYAIPLHNSNFDFACMSKGSLTKNQNENQAVFLSRVSGARAFWWTLCL